MRRRNSGFGLGHSSRRAVAPSQRVGFRSSSFRLLLGLSPRLCVSVVMLFVLAFLLSPISQLPASAQNLAIDWYTIDGGGGTSTGNAYAVTGTIGQPDASVASMSGGPYSLTGGFWALYAVQITGAPLLTIVPTGSGRATISWVPDTPGWVLQETTNLSQTNWMDFASGSTNPIIVPATGGTKFYRLRMSE